VIERKSSDPGWANIGEKLESQGQYLFSSRGGKKKTLREEGFPEKSERKTLKKRVAALRPFFSCQREKRNDRRKCLRRGIQRQEAGSVSGSRRGGESELHYL